LEKELGEDSFEGIFHLMRLILLKDKPQGDLLKEYQDRIFAQGSITQGTNFFDSVFRFADVFRSVFIDRDVVPEEDADHIKFRGLIHIMNAEFMASEWRACLLSFGLKFKGQQFYRFALMLEKVYFEQWVRGIRKDERYAVYAKILGLIDSENSPDKVIAKIKYDEDVIKASVGNPNLYGAGYCKYVLLRLELSASEHDVVKEISAKSVEHVLPQNPEPGGDWSRLHDEEEMKQYVHSAGNLVLLSKGKNSSAQNLEFPQKKEKYLKKRVSDYPRSVEVLGYTDWDKATILGRTKEAADLFLRDP
jgi:hypothetical protein